MNSELVGQRDEIERRFGSRYTPALVDHRLALGEAERFVRRVFTPIHPQASKEYEV